jgi:alkanesulfonate monooxygenase SsuD/methylene tetrahydromethanopterin reductase-like flavin-dependent oxidoreductase (luciferase family)
MPDDSGPALRRAAPQAEPVPAADVPNRDDRRLPSRAARPRIATLGDARLPIGVSLGTVGATVDWWLDGARRLDEAGYAGVWVWDHHGARGRPRPVLEGWTILTAAAAQTRRVAVGTHVLNIMNRHPAILAQMAATLQAVSGGRLIVGLGIGGHPADHEPLGIPLPDVAERVARLEETVAVLRALWSGEPASLANRFYPLRDARILPVPEPVPPILLAGQSSTGAMLAARIADGWTTRPDLLPRLLPGFRDALEAAGRQRSDVAVIVAFDGGRTGEDFLEGSPWVARPAETMAEWQAAGADAVIVTARTTGDVDRLVEAVGRW